MVIEENVPFSNEAPFKARESVRATQNHRKPVIKMKMMWWNLAYSQAYPRISVLAAELEFGFSRASIHKILKNINSMLFLR